MSITSFFKLPKKSSTDLDENGHGMVRYGKVMKHKNLKSTVKPFTRPLLVVTAVFMALMPMTAFADRFDDAINSIQGEVTGYQQQAADLRARGDTLQNALDAITAEKNALQAQINLNQAKYDKLTSDIQANEEKLDRQKRTLNKTIAQIYASGDTTPIVMLASSKNVGEYITAQEIRNTIRDQMKSAIDQVKKIKAELAQQRTDVEHVLADQNSQRQALAAKEAEQASIVAQTRNEEAAYQSMIATKNSEISNLRAQQAAANAAAARTYSVSGLTSGGSGCGGYPAIWCNTAQDTVVDNWGMFNRECVSYTAWKVAATGRYMPYWGGRGNANEWPGSAAADGIPTGSTPQVGSVAIMYVGYYGHAMYVEGLNGNGTIHVSQFNWGIRGEYTEMDVNPNGLTFIYF